MAVPVFRPSEIDSRLLVNEHVAADKLADSHLKRAATQTLEYLDEHGHIGLTKSGAFNRQFVTWAVHAVAWPGYTAAELYKLNKVLNEIDVLPIEVLHQLLRDGRLIRHCKSKALITRLGKAHLGNPGRVQAMLFEAVFTRLDFAHYERWQSPIDEVDAIHCLGVVQQRCLNWVDFSDFAPWCLPIPYFLHKKTATEEEAYFFVFSRVVRPLLWLGLLEIDRPSRITPFREMRVRRTALYDHFIHFEFDEGGSVVH